MPSTMEMNINSASLLITAILLIAEVFFYFAAIRKSEDAIFQMTSPKRIGITFMEQSLICPACFPLPSH